MKLILTIALSAIFILFLQSKIQSQSLESIISKGDSSYYIEYDYNKALEYYNLAKSISPNNYSVMNKISKTIIAIGDNLYSSLKTVEDEYKFGDKLNEESLDSNEIESAQIENYEQALAMADQSIRINPLFAEGYVRRAIANARIAVTKGIFSVAAIVNKIKEDLEYAIKLGNGGVDVQAVAHYVLAKTHDEVSEKWAPARSVIGLGWGDIEVALQEYNTAIKLKSDVIMFYLDYAKALLEEDEEEAALSMLEKVNYCKVMEPEDHNRIKEAEKLISELK